MFFFVRATDLGRPIFVDAGLREFGRRKRAYFKAEETGIF